MITNRYKILDKDIFTVELATNIVNVLSMFNSKVIINANNTKIDANSIINLMSLPIENLEYIIVEIDGSDALNTENELEQILIESGFVKKCN